MSNKRVLKARATGDFWKKKDVPQIRLQGKWVETAGIPKNARVEVSNPQPGVLVIRLAEAA